jgi:predicted Zn finger-like uncharacterized protein
MIVNCEGCESGFHVDELLIKPSGSKVRCSKCRHVFVAYPPPSAADTSEPLTLTEEVPAAGPAPVAAATDDIDLKLDALFPDEPADDGVAVTAKTDPGPQAAEALLEAARPGQETFASGPLVDDLELDLDLDDNSAMNASSRPAETVEPEELGASAVLPSLGMTDTDFGEFDFSKEQPKAEAKPGEEPISLDELELNLSELDVSEAAAAPAEPETPPLDNELELDFDLEALSAEGDSTDAAKAPESALEKALASSDLYEPAGAKEAALGDLGKEFEAAAPIASRPDSSTAQKSSGADELDLSDLEEMLEGVSSNSAVQPPQPAAGDIDFELDLSAEVAADTPKSAEPEDLDLAAIAQELDADKALASAGDAIEEELELDFDLERDEGAVKTEEPVVQAVGDELDFSDMAGILEGDALAAETTTAQTSDETSDLDLMLEDETALGGAAKASPAGSSAQQDLLLDIEALLKEDNEIDSAGGTPGAADMDIVIESADELADDKRFGVPAGAMKAARDSASAPAAEAVTDEFATDEFTGSDIGGATSVLDLEPVGAEAATAAAAPRSGMRKPLLAVLGALVLGILALVVMRFTGVSIPFISDLDIQVPGIGNLFKSEPADPLGNLKIAPLAEKISADFIDNAAAGRLVVVRGEVRNTYDHPRSSIRVTAKLYTQDKMVAKTATVFAGNVLSKEELGTLDLITMNSRFNMKTGANNINANVKPGDAIPFMAVFSNLPPNLDEYSVEIAGSLK